MRKKIKMIKSYRFQIWKKRKINKRYYKKRKKKVRLPFVLPSSIFLLISGFLSFDLLLIYLDLPLLFLNFLLLCLDLLLLYYGLLLLCLSFLLLCLVYPVFFISVLLSSLLFISSILSSFSISTLPLFTQSVLFAISTYLVYSSGLL